MRPRPLPGRSAGLVVPLFSLHSARSWGIGDIGDLALVRAMARARRLSRAAAAAGQHAAGGTDVAVLRAQRDGDRSDLRRRFPTSSDFEDLGGEPRLPLADQAALRRARCTPARALRRRAAGEGIGAAPGVQPVLRRRMAPHHGARRRVRGVRLMGRVVARRLRALQRVARAPRAAVVGGLAGAASTSATRPRSTTRRRELERRFSSTSTCSGWPTSSGRRRARRWARCGCSATSPSWWPPTAPTCGHGSICSASTRPSARAGRVQRDGAGLGASGLSLGRDGG